MRFRLALVLAYLAFVASPAEARQDNKERGDSAREACREEARQAIKKTRTARHDRDYLREMRREYARNCRQKAKTSWLSV